MRKKFTIILSFFIIIGIISAHAHLAFGEPIENSANYLPFGGNGYSSHYLHSKKDIISKVGVKVGEVGGFGPLKIKEDEIIQGVVSQDYYALVDIYNSTAGDNWTHNTNWLNDTIPVGQWYGVGVTNNRVVRLHLHVNNVKGINLVGNLPESIGNLTGVGSLRINNNPGLVGNIPSSIGNLKKCTHLWLHGTGLTGGLPENIGEMVSLTEISTYGTNIGGKIPDSFCKLSNLGQMWMRDSGFTGALPDSIGNLTKLWRIYLEDNDLSGELPSSFSQLKGLWQLKLHRNNFSGTLHGLPKSYGISELFLYSNNFTGEIPAFIGDFTSLKGLYLHDNDLSGELPSSMQKLANLTGFWLHYNYKITGDLPEWIGEWRNMKSLSIGDTDLGGEIPESIGNLTQMTGLYIQRTRIGGKIPESILQCTNLSVLDIKYMQLEGLPDFITQLPSLNLLIANNNSFTHLPDFSNHPNKMNLEILVDNNKLDFEDITKNFTGIDQHPFKGFTYRDQYPIDSLVVYPQDSLLVAQDSAVHNLYQWQQWKSEEWVNLEGATNLSFEATPEPGDTVLYYRCKIENEWVTDITLYTPVYHLQVNENENVIGDIPGNISSGYCSVGKLYTPESGVDYGTNYPVEGGAGVSGIAIDKINDKVYAGAGSEIWVLDRATNTGTILGKDVPIEGDPFPRNTLSMYLDEDKQELYVGSAGDVSATGGVWIYDIQANTSQYFPLATVLANGGDEIIGKDLFDIVKAKNSLYLSYYHGGLYIWDQEAETGKMFNAPNTGPGGKHEVQGDPMPDKTCTTSAYHIRNGKEYLYVGMEGFGLWEYNITDNIGRLMTPENTKLGGSQEVIGDPMVDHEMYNIHFIEDKLITGFWREQAVWIYDVSSNESIILSHETTKSDGIHEVDGDPIPGVEISNGEYFGGGLDVDYSRGTIYRAFEENTTEGPLHSKGGIWEYELNTNKASFYGFVDEGEDFINGSFFVIKKDEVHNKLYTTSWPSLSGGGIFELSYSENQCHFDDDILVIDSREFLSMGLEGKELLATLPSGEVQQLAVGQQVGLSVEELQSSSEAVVRLTLQRQGLEGNAVHLSITLAADYQITKLQAALGQGNLQDILSSSLYKVEGNRLSLLPGQLKVVPSLIYPALDDGVLYVPYLTTNGQEAETNSFWMRGVEGLEGYKLEIKSIQTDEIVFSSLDPLEQWNGNHQTTGGVVEKGRYAYTVSNSDEVQAQGQFLVDYGEAGL